MIHEFENLQYLINFQLCQFCLVTRNLWFGSICPVVRQANTTGAKGPTCPQPISASITDFYFHYPSCGPAKLSCVWLVVVWFVSYQYIDNIVAYIEKWRTWKKFLVTGASVPLFLLCDHVVEFLNPKWLNSTIY